MGRTVTATITATITRTATATTTTTSITTTSTSTTLGKRGFCVLYGDPHILTFDRFPRSKIHFRHPGTYWIVKSSRISIYATYEQNNRGWITMFAITGSFLQ